MSIPMLDCDSLYADLGDIEAVNLLSFAYKIASGMVSTEWKVICVVYFFLGVGVSC